MADRDEQTILRCVTFGVASPLDCTWEELWADLHACWAQTTSCANWLMTELAKADVVRQPGDAKLPPLPATYFYPRTSRLFGGLDTRTCASLERAVKRKYKAVRYDVVWRHAASLPSFRYPTPYPVHNQAWRPYYDAGNRPCLSLPLGRGTDHRRELRLRGGADHRRQLGLFRHFVDGVAVKSEAKVYARGGKLLVGLVGRFPGPEARERQGLLTVRTCPTSLWVVQLEDEEPRYWNHDDLRRLQISHLAYLQRIAEDSKHELRLPPGKLRHVKAARRVRCEKHARRVRTALHQLSAQLVGFAQRRQVAVVAYDDTDKSWLDKLPWAQLKLDVRYKLQGLGIDFWEGLPDPEPVEGGGERSGA